MLNAILAKQQSSLAVLCEQFGVSHLYAFGSSVNGAFNSESDMDFLAQFKNRKPTIEYVEQFFGLESALHSLFNRPIDLVTVEGLRRSGFAQEVNRTKVLVYETGTSSNPF